MTTDPESSVERPVLSGFPANLSIGGRRCLVVGAGRIAFRKINRLLDQNAVVEVVAPEASAEVRALVEAGRCTWAQREFALSDVDGAWLVITATGVPAVDHAVFEAREERQIWVNSADDPSNCSLTLMALVRRGDIVVAIGTNGRSPALSAHLADRFRKEIGEEYETLLVILEECRLELIATGSSTEASNWRGALESGILELIREGRLDEARELLRSCL